MPPVSSAVGIVLTALIAVNALYVTAEFAAVSVKRSRIRRLADEGNRAARQLLPEIEDPRRLDRYVAICQIGITLSSLLLGAYGQAKLAPWLAPTLERWGELQTAAALSSAAALVLLALTAAQMVLGELVPKSLALQFSTRAALLSVRPMRWSGWLFSWFIAILNGSGMAILRRLGVPDSGHRHIHSPDEIELLIVESRDGGLLEHDESLRLRRALRLRLRRVHQLMVPRREVKALDADAPFEEWLRTVAEGHFTRFPVYRGTLDHIVGVLDAKDVVQRLAQGRLKSIHDALRRPVFVPSTLRVDRLLPILRERRAQMAVALDEQGGCDGVVTLNDVLREVLGESAEEFVLPRRSPERLADGRVRLPGRLPHDRAAAWIGASWSGGRGTIGGAVLERLGRVPRPGDRVTILGFEVEVEAVDHHEIESVLVSPAAECGDG